MSVYVDSLMEHGWVLRGHVVKSCHMYADTLPELHAMAAKIGMSRTWFQCAEVAMPHYDLTASRRAAAVSFGAIEHSRRQMVAFLRAWRDKEPSGKTTR